MQKAELNILNFGQVKAILIFVKFFQYFVSLDKNRDNSVILKDFVDPHHTPLNFYWISPRMYIGQYDYKLQEEIQKTIK